MKALTTILMLCLPVAAMGETYVCTSTYGVAINENELMREDIPSVSWVADTRRGLRVPDPIRAGNDYLGECEVTSRYQSASSTSCSVVGAGTGRTNHHIRIEKLINGDIEFWASIFNLYNFAYAGTCTEI